MSGRLGALIGLGRIEEARTLARRWLVQLQAADMAESSGGILGWLALAEAALGQRSAAITIADIMVRGIDSARVTGFTPGRSTTYARAWR